MKLHRCPECAGTLVTPEEWGAIHLDCPVCQGGTVFRDARGGYECTECDQRFLIHGEPPQGYGGPDHIGGLLRWWEKPLTGWGALGILVLLGLVLWLIPKVFSTVAICLFFWRYWYDEHHRGTPGKVLRR